jgi:predicted nucleic acid-binding protein
MRVFLDSNLLVYAADVAAAAKYARAHELIREHMPLRTGVVSTRVLPEHYSAATRKLGVEAELARDKVALFARFEVITIGTRLILGAIDRHRLNAVSFWDALIITAAQQAGCRRLYSEDMQDGPAFDDLKVVNPFDQ